MQLASCINTLRYSYLEGSSGLAWLFVQSREVWGRTRGSSALISKSKINFSLSNRLCLSLVNGKHQFFDKFVVLRISFRSSSIDNLRTLSLFQEDWCQGFEMRFPMKARHDFFRWNWFHWGIWLKMFVRVQYRFQLGSIIEIAAFRYWSLNCLLW